MTDFNNDASLDDFVTDFAAETLEMLDSIEPDLQSLLNNSSPVSKDLINRIHRTIHSIKGGAGFSGFRELKTISQTMEEVVIPVRDGRSVFDPQKINSLLSGVATIRRMIANIHKFDSVSFDKEIEEIRKIVAQEAAPEIRIVAREPVCVGFIEPEMLEKETGDTSGAEEEGIMDQNLMKEFVDDIKDLLTSIEPDFLSMEKERENVSPDLINRVFRAMHSIKGGSGFCGFQDLKELSHAMENVLMMVRDGNMNLDPGKMDILLAGIDKISMMVNRIDTTEKVPYQNELIALKKIIDEQSNTEKVPKESLPEKHEVAILPVQKKVEAIHVIDASNSGNGKKQPVGMSAVQVQNKCKAPPETIRISVDLVDRLMNLAGELVLSRNQLRQAIERYILDDPRISPIIQNVDVVTSEIQENIVRMRMQPLGNVLSKFPRTVRDMTRQMSKEAEMIIEGGDVELDKTILESLTNPLTHLVRNCVDHGIETPSERIASGKPPAGQIYIKAYHEGGHVNIVLKDDGRGINIEKVTDIVLKKNLLPRDQVLKMGEKERLNLIFLPGLTTAAEVTDISGRGVGMDVVRTNIEKIGGHIDIETLLGHGTTVHIVIPLTLAIIPCLIVGVGNQRFAVPQINVQELVCIKAGETAHKIESVGESSVLRLRGHLLAILRLTDIMGMDRTFVHPKTGEVKPDKRQRVVDRRSSKTEFLEKESISDDMRTISDRRQNWRSDIYVVVLRVGSNTFGLCVDELYDNEEIVVKPLSNHIKNCKIFAGATIMGDGRVAMILDSVGIASLAKLKFNEIKTEERRRKSLHDLQKKAMGGDQKQSIIIFNNSSDEYFGLPLAGISRLEIIEPNSIKTFGEQEFFSYRGDGVPLIRLERLLPVKPIPNDAKELFVIIPKSKTSLVGIMASRILDTIDVQAIITRHPTTTRGFSGSIILSGMLIFFLDTEELLNLFKERILSLAPAGAVSFGNDRMDGHSNGLEGFNG